MKFEYDNVKYGSIIFKNKKSYSVFKVLSFFFDTLYIHIKTYVALDLCNESYCIGLSARLLKISYVVLQSAILYILFHSKLPHSASFRWR